jgi:hypothetical protein
LPRGTLHTLDTLASSQQSIAQYGEDNAFEAIDAALEAHNEILTEMVGELCEVTTDRQRRYGSYDAMKMEETDEYGTPDAQKISAGATVGFPLRNYSLAVQWTRKYFQNVTGEEFVAQFTSATTADVKRVQREIKRALFYPVNYTFEDKLIDHVQLAVKALANADGASIPLGPQGQEFDGATHNHYLGTAAFVEANVVTLVETVLEHYASGDAVLYINRAQEAAFKGFAKFTPYVDAHIIPGANTTEARGTLNPNLLYDRAIGIFDGSAEVWVKPWVPAGYVFCYLKETVKPLVFRVRAAGQGLQLVYDDEAHPLRARVLEREFGVAVWNRVNGAVLYTGGAVFTTPVL